MWLKDKDTIQEGDVIFFGNGTSKKAGATVGLPVGEVRDEYFLRFWRDDKLKKNLTSLLAKLPWILSVVLCRDGSGHVQNLLKEPIFKFHSMDELKKYLEEL